MVRTDPNQREAFATLYSQMAPRLYRTALGILGNPHDAADALQEAGMKAFRYYESLNEPAAAAGWLTRILINACHDVGRKRSRMIPTGLEVLPDTAAQPAGTGDGEMLLALQGLPEEQRTTVVLRFFQDLSIPQIARVMGVPEGTVKSRLHASLGKLRHVLQDAGKEGAQ